METTESTKGNKPNNRRRKAAKRRAQLLEPTPDIIEETPDETPKEIELSEREIADGWHVVKWFSRIDNYERWGWDTAYVSNTRLRKKKSSLKVYKILS